MSVLAHDGLVYLGTTIDGALGAPASDQAEGHFIVWDPEAEKVVQDIVPVAGDDGVTGLIVGPDGLIWGVSEDTVFKYDPKAEQITYSEKLLRHRYGSGTVWMWGDLAVGADGNVYGTNRFSFFKIDAETMAYSDIVPTTAMGSPIMNAISDDDGDILFSHGPYVFKYDVEQGEPACTIILDERVDDGLVVAADEVVCGSGVDIRGGATIAASGTLRLDHSSVHGALTADRAAAISISDTHLAGAVTITNTVGVVVFAGNDVRGSFACAGNAAGLEDHGAPNAITGAIVGCSLF